MRAIDTSSQRYTALAALRWALIAICAVLIAFSENMAGRIGFAALLVLAVIIGRYGRARLARPLGSAHLDQTEPAPAPRQASEADVRHREAGH